MGGEEGLANLWRFLEPYMSTTAVIQAGAVPKMCLVNSTRVQSDFSSQVVCCPKMVLDFCREVTPLIKWDI